MEYLVSQKALETIELECRKFPDTETGGLLVGFRDSQQAAISHATGPGPNADRSSHHFTKDTPYLQAVLNLLAHYYRVAYLGVWHKHPNDMPFPSAGDIFSAMEEVSDQAMGLVELITPICLLEQGRVEIIPFVIKEGRFRPVDWEAVAHQQLLLRQREHTQWYDTPAGRDRLAQEVEMFRALGVKADVRRGSDGSYRFHVPLGAVSHRRLVMLCPEDYPVTPPEVAVYDRWSKNYEPVTSPLLNDWNLYRLLADLFREHLGG